MRSIVKQTDATDVFNRTENKYILYVHKKTKQNKTKTNEKKNSSTFNLHDVCREGKSNSERLNLIE